MTQPTLESLNKFILENPNTNDFAIKVLNKLDNKKQSFDPLTIITIISIIIQVYKLIKGCYATRKGMLYGMQHTGILRKAKFTKIIRKETKDMQVSIPLQDEISKAFHTTIASIDMTNFEKIADEIEKV